MGIPNEIKIDVLKALAENDLLLIDNGETLAECDLEVTRKKKNDGKEVVLFIVKSRG